ncbi:DUF3093 domain-containing protein [Hoyosella rhizosphaerae]|uniref:DUF3093 domain-containing protein n=1 Tax=Hoyosella rhizosphaerae TaxID=1755582 RepID=UPI0016661F5C|nr:DUF3093 domain-containing protein [Hoyosella rhizosphaerae]MBN4926385.1 DUF3093 domain-containing protein [Hoyosella rhizosphaerae]
MLYSEKLWVPWWWWPLGLFASSMVALQFAIGIRTLPTWLPFLLLAPIPLWVLWHLSRTQISVTQDGNDPGTFHAGDAHLPINVIARVAAIPATAKQAAMGRQLDPAAFVQHRTWINTLILVVLDDPDDPTPYWLVSTRTPDKLVGVLNDVTNRK